MVFGVLGGACLAITAGLLVQMHLLATGLDPLGDAVSLYGATEAHRYYRAMVVAFGAGALLVAAGLASATDAGHLIWLDIFGVCRIAIAGAMIDREPGVGTLEGRIHVALAVVAFAAIGLAGARITWSGAPAALHPAGQAIVASVLATVVARFSPMRLFGLAERLIYASSLVWLAIAAGSLVLSG
jgi:hypothetical protein